MQQHAVTPGRVLLDAEGIQRTLSRIAHEIIERNEDLGAVALVGIHTRGVPLAQRLRRLIEVDALVPSVRGCRLPRDPNPFNPVQRGRKGVA